MITQDQIDKLARDSALLDSIRQEIDGEGFEDMGDLHLTIRGAIKQLRKERDAAYDKGFTAHLDLTMTAVPEPKNPTLWRYLENAYQKQITFHSIGVNRMPDGGYHFYIHPQSVSGDTEDFLLWPDPFNWNDMLVNKKDSPAPSFEEFQKFMKKTRPQEKDGHGMNLGAQDVLGSFP